jgi:AcrR family transcriptional regulator
MRIMRESEPHRTLANRPPGVRERILTAALEGLSQSGIQGLTQVQVARRAGVRQSHLTYYFPTRDDLLGAVTEVAVDGIASGLRQLVVDRGSTGYRAMLERLAEAVADLAHMRMFVAMIVEADRDVAVRKVMTRATHRMEAALAEALGGAQTVARARCVLVAAWGLGLYRFLMRPSGKADPTRSYLSWLAESSAGRRARGRRSSARK